MKRIFASILLLMLALFISKPFAAESSQLYPTTDYQISDIDHPGYFIAPNLADTQPLLKVGCPCDTPYPNPTIKLVITAAITAWVTMASFIYGSHFIAGLIAN
ncbi:MAG: hypothetical protein HC875_10845 [Anaerolineales bacterium]|nr:hypothetical protein [Anaerolineales bacterium]